VLIFNTKTVLEVSAERAPTSKTVGNDEGLPHYGESTGERAMVEGEKVLLL